jgi:cytochrome c-type biogenesis protein CcmH/NrfG
MTNAPTSEAATNESLQPTHVYLAAAVCLVLGLAIGYGSRTWQPLPGTMAVPSPATASATAPRNPHAPSLDQMKQMADKQAAPLLEKLKSSPADSALLTQVGAIYHGSHQFKDAAAYYDKAVQADPKNIALRNRLASSLYRSGDVDGAIVQLNQALAYDPKDANSLFNLGMIRLQGQGDGKAALAAWQKLLKSNPQLSAERKAEVQKLMADVLTTMGDQRGSKGAAGK